MEHSNISQYYNSVGGQYRMSSTRRTRVLALFDTARRSLQNKKLSVLDIGIGNAEIARYCREILHGDDWYIEGIDISRELVDAQRGYYSRTRVVNVDDPQWHQSFDRKFDIVVASELLEHLFRPDLFLQRLSEIINPGGFVLLTTPNLLLWSHRIKFLFGNHEYAEGGVYEWGHIHLLSWNFLKKTISKAGFEIVDSLHLMHPNSLNHLHHFLPGLFAFQFILIMKKKSNDTLK